MMRVVCPPVERLGVGAVYLLGVVAVYLDRVPAEGPRSVCVVVAVPAVHGLARLAEAVHVEDGDEVVQLVEGVLEGFHIDPSAISESPHRTQTR